MLSCEAGCRKPEPGAFQHVLDRLGLPGEAVAHVDDFPEYVQAATALGIRPIRHRGDVPVTRRAIMTLLDERRWQQLGETPVRDGYWQELPGGDRDEGESIEESAARECEEETGYRPLAVKHVLTMSRSGMTGSI